MCRMALLFWLCPCWCSCWVLSRNRLRPTLNSTENPIFSLWISNSQTKTAHAVLKHHKYCWVCRKYWRAPTKSLGLSGAHKGENLSKAETFIPHNLLINPLVSWSYHDHGKLVSSRSLQKEKGGVMSWSKLFVHYPQEKRGSKMSWTLIRHKGNLWTS